MAATASTVNPTLTSTEIVGDWRAIKQAILQEASELNIDWNVTGRRMISEDGHNILRRMNRIQMMAEAIGGTMEA